MAKAPELISISNPTTATEALNTNNARIIEAFQNTISRDGSTPNSLNGDIDLNSNDLLNVNRIDVQNLTVKGLPLTDNLEEAIAEAEAAATASAVSAAESLAIATEFGDLAGAISAAEAFASNSAASAVGASGFADNASVSAVAAETARTNAETAQALAEAARDAAATAQFANRGWVANAAALSTVANPAVDDRALTLDDEHVHRWDGTAWQDDGVSPVGLKADQTDLAGVVDDLAPYQANIRFGPGGDIEFCDRFGRAVMVIGADGVKAAILSVARAIAVDGISITRGKDGLALTDAQGQSPIVVDTKGRMWIGSAILGTADVDGRLDIRDRDGKAAAATDPTGRQWIASAVIGEMEVVGEFAVPTAPSGGYRGRDLAALVDHVGSGGNVSRQGPSQALPLGADLRRLGAVLVPGAYDWMTSKVESPAIWDDDDRLYHMVFTAYSGNPGTPIAAAIGHATSSDLVNWTVDAEPLLTGTGVAGDPDESGCTGPVMYKRDGVYYLYYISLPADGYESGVKRICLATATDLAGPWTRHGVKVDRNTSAPWRASDVYHVSIVERRGTFFMFFNAKGTGSGDNSQGNERIGVATAPAIDGPWAVDDDTVLINTVNDTWESQKVGDPAVYFDPRRGIWRMVYFGFNGSAASDGDAWTTDEDFPYGWQKNPANPILRKATNSSWDKGYAHKPFIFIEGSRVYHYYTGVTSSAFGGICLRVTGLAVDRQWVGDDAGLVRRVEASPHGTAYDRWSRDDGLGPSLLAGYDGVSQRYRIGRNTDNGYAAGTALDSDGADLALGSAAALAPAATAGFAWIPRLSGAPISAPPAAWGDRVPLAYDAANDRLCIYVAGLGWRFFNAA